MSAIAYTVAELADEVNGEIRGDPRCVITGLAPLASARAGQMTHLSHARYRAFLKNTQASAILLSPKDADKCTTTALIVSNPEACFAKIARLFEPTIKPNAGIHASAVVDPSAQIGDHVSIGPHCVIGENVKIGANSVIMANTTIMNGVSLGADSILYPQISIYHDVTIGNRVLIHSGVVIGADGFGLAQEDGKWIRIPQLGRVVIEDDVDIGANTTIDRGALEDTFIGEGVKLDNQIQIGHNVSIGAHTVIAGTAAIAGSTKLGRYCMVGGGARINGHITIADQVVISGTAMVFKSITEPGIYSSGTGIQRNREWARSVKRFHQLDEIVKRIKKLEKRSDE